MSIVKWLAVALYAAVLVVAPFTHHDLACHLKDPQHCTACTSNPVSTDPATFTAPGFVPLVDLGSAEFPYSSAETVLLAAESTGRSPPASL